MKAFLLAAGEGRRLRPLTDSVPKCLVPIQGTPLLAIWLRLLEMHGVTHVLVNLHHLGEHVRSFLAAQQTTLAIETVHEPRLLGSAGTVLANQEFVAGDPDFLILYADNLTTVNLGRLVGHHRRRAETLTIGVAPTDRPQEKGTVLIDPEGRVTEFIEKAPRPRSHLANAGMYVARQKLFDYLRRSPPADAPLDFGHDVLPAMVPDVAAYGIEEFLMDIGTPEQYQDAQAVWPGLAPGRTLAATSSAAPSTYSPA